MPLGALVSAVGALGIGEEWDLIVISDCKGSAAFDWTSPRARRCFDRETFDKECLLGCGEPLLNMHVRIQNHAQNSQVCSAIDEPERSHSVSRFMETIKLDTAQCSVLKAHSRLPVPAGGCCSRDNLCGNTLGHTRLSPRHWELVQRHRVSVQ